MDAGRAPLRTSVSQAKGSSHAVSARHRHERIVRRQIVGLSVLAGLGWVLVVVALFMDPHLLSVGHGLLGPLFVAAQLLLGVLVWRLVGDLGHGPEKEAKQRPSQGAED